MRALLCSTALAFACAACATETPSPTLLPSAPVTNFQSNVAADDPNCREYTGEATIAGVQQQILGRACRQSDGSWRVAEGTPVDPAQYIGIYPAAPAAYYPYYPYYPYYGWYDPWFWGPPFGFGASFVFFDGHGHHHHNNFHHGFAHGGTGGHFGMRDHMGGVRGMGGQMGGTGGQMGGTGGQMGGMGGHMGGMGGHMGGMGGHHG
jgi:hypothetical protein